MCLLYNGCSEWFNLKSNRLQRNKGLTNIEIKVQLGRLDDSGVMA